ncbi:serine O-acetyltransferase [Fusobacterium sp.]|uniref:serine O-acetyltransferase n=1 Tax=Fusobacterium sp. TaxID=68766 RepID=UPI002E794B53|nr:DapH/DapD/GlmU-related protein [Fusobacterium sp.]MEE1475881.1 DapH/DapD/GlmU-related protein [Fusobacterium sp.]
MNKYIESDLYRYTKSTKGFLREYLKNSAFRFSVAHRLVNSNIFFEKIIGVFLWGINRSKRKNIQIPRQVKIGYGLYIGHNGPVIINSTAMIGNNCNLSQFVTIGSNEGKAAIIGNNVYIGPNVCIVENIKIGDNVTIGAGSVVTKDIPNNATVAGNYAKILNYNNSGRYI